MIATLADMTSRSTSESKFFGESNVSSMINIFIPGECSEVKDDRARFLNRLMMIPRHFGVSEANKQHIMRSFLTLLLERSTPSQERPCVVSSNDIVNWCRCIQLATWCINYISISILLGGSSSDFFMGTRIPEGFSLPDNFMILVFLNGLIGGGHQARHGHYRL
jgi:hypothetical protein